MGKSYLFLQGPHGPFFKQLGDNLKDEGHRVLRINFNGGDWIDWNGHCTIDYTGSQKDWDAYITNLYHNHKITDLIVYGDCRRLHSAAIKIAAGSGIRVHVFEEGYIRPNWITLESDGVNGNSNLIANKQGLIKELQSSKNDRFDDKVEKIGPSMRWIIFYCLRYYLFKSLFYIKFRNYIRHRPYRPFQELLLWIGNLLHLPILVYRTNKKREPLFKQSTPYFLVCLQLDSDAQLREHSNYLSMANFINEVLRSFHKHAPENSILVFKKHPLDPGAIPYSTLTRLEAHSLGIRERTLFLHSGSLPDLIKNSQGVVLMNSTVGTSALHHGKPTIVMGKAIYDLPGLTYQDGLDNFWNKATAPDADLFHKLRSKLLRETLIHGGFYHPHGRNHAIVGSAKRILKTSTTKNNQVTEELKNVVSLRGSDYH